MSIYFVHIILAFFALTLFSALTAKNQVFLRTFVPAFLGAIVGLIIFKFARYYLLDAPARLFFDGLGVVFLLLSFSVVFFEFKFKWIIFGFLGASYGASYGAISALFPLFSGELLDTQSIISAFLLLFAVIILVSLFFTTNLLSQKIPPKALKSLSILTLLVMLIFKLSGFILELMRNGAINTKPEILSLVAKGLYLSIFAPYIFSAVLALFCVIALSYRPKQIDKKSLIAYRFNKALRSLILSASTYVLLSIGAILAFSLYYDLVASRPPSLSEPIYLEPENDKFVINTDVLADNDLHRYAYITDEGRVIRFFLINRYEDKPSAVAVFDACSICGDTGYVKHGSELICVSCNVRIFLPSVGKEGGCNPLPLEHTYDGKTITISLDALLAGANQFSAIVEKEVLDLVSGEKISNKSKFSYRFKNRTYFFSSKQNLERFEANPDKFIGASK